MKKIVIISATSATNLDLSDKLLNILDELDVSSEIINAEDHTLPMFVASTYESQKKEYYKTIDFLTKKLIESSGIIICSPEYNGSIPPIITNMIAWISVSTDYWRDGFNKKISLIASSSGGGGTKYFIAMKNQLEHLGSVVMPRGIQISSSNPLNEESAKKILKHFINLL